MLGALTTVTQRMSSSKVFFVFVVVFSVFVFCVWSAWLRGDRKGRGGNYAAGWLRNHAPPFLFFGLLPRFQLHLCFLVLGGFGLVVACMVEGGKEEKRGEPLDRLTAQFKRPLCSSFAPPPPDGGGWC